MKKHTRKTNYKEKGITLIALVVTIIVLLILAGVTLNLVLGQNGIINRSQYASNTWANATVNELAQMEQYASDVESLTSGFIAGGGSTSTEPKDPTSEGTSVTELREGDRVIYTTKDGTQVPCVVLYDSTGEYGIQVVTADTIGTNIEVGPYGEDPELSNSYTMAKEAYNTIVSIFNIEAQKYVNTDLSPDWGARSVGTDPKIRPVTVENDDGTYVSNYTRFQPYDNQFKDGELRRGTYGDENKITDWVQMGKSHINCRNARFAYFLGCRYISDSMDDQLSFGAVGVSVGYMYPDVSLSPLVTLGYGQGSWGRWYGLRAVFILKDNVTYVTSGDNKILVCE